jgi:hypothetical protein
LIVIYKQVVCGSYPWRRYEYDGLELVAVFLVGVVEPAETFETGGGISEFLNPLVEERVCEFEFVSFVEHAVADHEAAEVVPFGHAAWQFILLSDLGFS